MAPPPLAPRPVLVELFTSQGCSSCPPADDAFAALADRPDVVALAFHVTYWDRLGWRDTFGDERFTERQRTYAAWLGTGQFYTPQAVVAGEVHLVGSDSRLEALIARVRERSAPVAIRVASDGRVRLPALAQPADATLWAAAYDDARTARIERGENAGRTITYRNVVRELVDLGAWDGREHTLRLPEPLANRGVGGDLVVVAQEPGLGTILALGHRRGGVVPA